TPVLEMGVEHNRSAVVGVFGCDHVIAGSQRMKDTERGGASGRKRERRGSLFERRQRRLQALAIGIVGSAVKGSAGKAAVAGFFKSGGLVDGWDHITRASFRRAAGVHGAGFNLHRTLGYTKVEKLSRAPASEARCFETQGPS